MSFLQTPYIPSDSVKLAVLDYRADAQLEAALYSEGVSVIRTTPCKELYDAINGHPDILLHHTGENRIVLAPNVFDQLSPVLLKKGFALTKGATWLSRNYPENIAYNVLRVGSYAFHNTKYTDIRILEEFEKLNVKTIHVNQGYTKCSVCIINAATIITSDIKLANAAEKNGIESLLIKPGGIELTGLNYGFIGGASGLIGNNKLAFTGCVENIPEANRIIDFLNIKGIEVKILTNKQIKDIGSIIPLKY